MQKKFKISLFICLLSVIIILPSAFASPKSWSDTKQYTWLAHNNDGVWPVVTYVSLSLSGDYNNYTTSTVSTNRQDYIFIVTMPLHDNFNLTSADFQHIQFTNSSGNVTQFTSSYFSMASGKSYLISSDTVAHGSKADKNYHVFSTPASVQSQVTMNFSDSIQGFAFMNYSFSY